MVICVVMIVRRMPHDQVSRICDLHDALVTTERPCCRGRQVTFKFDHVCVSAILHIVTIKVRLLVWSGHLVIARLTIIVKLAHFIDPAPLAAFHNHAFIWILCHCQFAAYRVRDKNVVFISVLQLASEVQSLICPVVRHFTLAASFE